MRFLQNFAILCKYSKSKLTICQFFGNLFFILLYGKLFADFERALARALIQRRRSAYERIRKRYVAYLKRERCSSDGHFQRVADHLIFTEQSVL